MGDASPSTAGDNSPDRKRGSTLEARGMDEKGKDDG